jgi:regulator of cell morphogenesis and NO signaling
MISFAGINKIIQMKIENLTLAEIVSTKPAAAALFEKHNLDFCCGGKRKLVDVLLNDNAKLNEVTDQLHKLFKKNTTEEIDFNALSLTQLVDYIIETHHKYVKENLPVIQLHLEKVATKHGVAHPEMKEIKILFDEIKRDFEQHMLKEELILFPRIKKLEALVKKGNPSNETFSLEGPVAVMEFEHEAAHTLLDKIKTASNNYTPPATACNTYRLSLNELSIFESDLHRHVHLENNILFPKALAMLGK